MANFLFLGVIILGYFIYKFLRRILFVEFHHAYDDTLQSSFSPANVIAAGKVELWENEVTYNRLKNVSNSTTASQKYLVKNQETDDIFEKNRISKPNPVTNKSHFKTSYQIDYDEEERDMRKKEKIYIEALNRGRPDGHPKILKLPDVGYMPTIFEKMPYPVTAEVLRLLAEEETGGISKTANVLKEEAVHNQLDSKTGGKRPSDMRTEKNILVEEQALTQLTSNKGGRKARSMQTANKGKKEPLQIQLSNNTAKREADCLQLDKNADGEVTPRIPKKKKKFRKLRKFFSRFSCIPKVKE